MKIIGILVCLGIIFLQNTAFSNADVPISEATAECIDCHASVHPGIVDDWGNSRHAKITPNAAMAIEGLARKISSKNGCVNIINHIEIGNQYSISSVKYRGERQLHVSIPLQ